MFKFMAKKKTEVEVCEDCECEAVVDVEVVEKEGIYYVYTAKMALYSAHKIEADAAKVAEEIEGSYKKIV